jgi:predicted metal-binding protein
MKDQGAPSCPAELLICVRCRRGLETAEDMRPGAHLYEAMRKADLPDGVTVTPVECLQNCDHGCTVALRGPGRWTYVFGNLHETSHLDTLIDGASRYHATQDGLIPWRERPEHFRKNCVARIPPLEPENA